MNVRQNLGNWLTSPKSCCGQFICSRGKCLSLKNFLLPSTFCNFLPRIYWHLCVLILRWWQLFSHQRCWTGQPQKLDSASIWCVVMFVWRTSGYTVRKLSPEELIKKQISLFRYTSPVFCILYFVCRKIKILTPFMPHFFKYLFPH